MKPEQKISITIADDHPIFRNGLRQTIEEDPGIEIIGEADNGKKALELILELNPDIALLDIEMPHMTGLDVLRELKDNKEKTKLIFLTVYADEDIFDEAMELGISGYVLKDSAINDIIECIYKVNEGNYYISPSVSNFLLSRREQQERFRGHTHPLKNLTKAELLILRLISDGKTSKEISQELKISSKTVENHRTNISNKLNLKGANSVIKFAIEHRSEFTI